MITSEAEDTGEYDITPSPASAAARRAVQVLRAAGEACDELPGRLHAKLVRFRRSLPAPRILIVEDDVDLADVLAKFLERGGVIADVVTTAERALANLRRSRYRLVIADVGLPAATGAHLCAAIRSSTRVPLVPILLISGRVDSLEGESLADLALEAGANDYLSKPFDLPELQRKVTSLLAPVGMAEPERTTRA